MVTSPNSGLLSEASEELRKMLASLACAATDAHPMKRLRHWLFRKCKMNRGHGENEAPTQCESHRKTTTPHTCSRARLSPCLNYRGNMLEPPSQISSDERLAFYSLCRSLARFLGLMIEGILHVKSAGPALASLRCSYS